MSELPDWVPEGVEITVPNAARVYDYVLGGYHNFAADREFVAEALKAWPDAAAIGHANRAFLRRSVRWLVQQGIRQFLDLGSGIPTLGNVHEIAQAVAPDSRIVYVDIDPVAVAHSQAILVDNPLAHAIRADLRDADGIVRHEDVTRLLDFARPVAVLYNSVLHFVPDTAEVTAGVHRIREALVGGSYLVITHATPVTELAHEQEQVTKLYQRTPTEANVRTREEVLAMLSGLELVEPGLVPVTDWHPDPEEADVSRQPTLLGVVARLP